MAKFLSGKDLEEAVYDIIYEAKKSLLIISPFIRLDEYFRKELFDKHQGNANLVIVIVFGKNENNVTRSFNKGDFEYFMKFPNISIIYAPNLHAKYYANEKRSIITSINLYDTSFRQNIEFGVITEPAIIGSDKIHIDSWQKSMEILSGNSVVFIRKPNFKKRMIVVRDYVGSETIYDVTSDLIEKGTIPKKCLFDFDEPELIDAIKNESRTSREEFEKQHSSEITEINSSSLNGRCIRCNEKIPIDIKLPFCSACFKEWNKTKNPTGKENYCHICGKHHPSTKIKPACFACFSSHKIQTRP